jgi:putative tricarboxylic transport membrane protein
MGLFAIADFLINVNQVGEATIRARVRLREMLPTWADIKQTFLPTVRGTLIGTLFGAMPGTGPAITTFIAYAFERKVSRTPERFGNGAPEGVAASEAAAHSKTQVDFIPTMSLGIPGDSVMALLLGALIVQGVQPGPQLITDHPDLFWGLVASFWVGNALLMILNVPLIGIWVRMLQVPFRFMFPCALFFIAIGVYSTNNSLFEVYEVLFFGVVGAILLMLDFPVATILLGYVLGPQVEENFRRSLLLSRGDLMVFLQHPISAAFMIACAAMILLQCFFALRKRSKPVDRSADFQGSSVPNFD